MPVGRKLIEAEAVEVINKFRKDNYFETDAIFGRENRLNTENHTEHFLKWGDFFTTDVYVLSTSDLEDLSLLLLCGAAELQHCFAYVITSHRIPHELSEGWTETYLWFPATSLMLEIGADQWRAGEVTVVDQTIARSRNFHQRRRLEAQKSGT